MKKNKNWFGVLKIIGNILTVFAVLFIVRTIYKMDIDFTAYHSWKIVIVYGLIGCTGVIIGFACAAFAWERLLETLNNKKLQFKQTYYVYTKANIGKYLPGNIMHYVERNLFVANHGIGQLETLASSAFEITGTIIAAFIICIVLSWKDLFSFFSSVKKSYLMIIVISVIVAIAVLVILCKKSIRIRKILSLVKTRKFLIVFLGNICLYIILFLAHGATLILSVQAIRPIFSLHDILQLVSMNTLAWLVGFLIPGVPGGIGVRELVLSTMASGTEYANIILIAAVGQRVVLVAADFLSYLLGIVVGKTQKKGNDE